ncbi:hypothetical protein THAOC_19285 [Thalassiosira oceanica]|uniref:Uncharacterized protein n=1 Tax=Thalassiosira oceanica TaxID=159749 RepID=K0S642_THAOC|nr:hypothetical protein THAOC_19285 [Thalassiosira oceanica]|eukprot:EJK60374.1 hypothetical protein THAOC_19285 [Thalassiosira oceanica]
MEPIFPVDKWTLEGERSLNKHRYNLTDATEYSEHERHIDSILASCDVSNTTGAIRTVAILATTFQFATSHISKVTDHIIKNVAIYRRIPETQDEWSVRLGKANSVCNFLRVRKLHELVEGLIKAFEEYSTDDCHPYFEHKSKLVQLRDELRFKHTHFLGFRRQPYAYTYQVYGIAASVRQYRDAVLPELHSWAVSLRELVLVFDDVGKYSRSITLGIVKRFPPGSPKRHEAIIRLDQEGRAARASVYEELKSESRYKMIVHDEWKRSHRHSTVSSPGCILIDLCPVQTTMNETNKRCRFETAHVTMDIFSPKCHDLSYLRSNWEGYRFYFCPRRFPPPYDANKIWDCESFNHLRWYIKHCSEKGDSPVYYNGGKGGLTRRFLCTRKTSAGKGCKYGFSVSCDMLHGYYIISRTLSSHNEHNCRGSLYDLCQQAGVDCLR